MSEVVMRAFSFNPSESIMLRQLVDRETKRVRDLPTGENKGDLRMSEKAIWLAELNNMRTELTRYEGYKEVVTNE